MHNVLVLGSKGTLGGQLLNLFPAATGWDREDVDVSNLAALRAKVAGLPSKPEAIVNCVAFNDVDGAEDHPDRAMLLNAYVPGELAKLTRGLGIPLVHYSTNYVFDGVAGEYAEADTPNPLSVYGLSKLEGERSVARHGGQWYIARTAVIFGPKGVSELSKKSFVDLMLDLSAKRDSLQVVSGEVNSLTYAPDLAAGTKRLLELAPEPGIYHITNGGQASWYDFAQEIFRAAGRATVVTPVSSAQFPRKAERPAKAVLLNTKLPPMRPWQEAVAEFLGAR